MKKKEKHSPPTDAEAQVLYEKIIERERNDKRPFLTIAFDFQMKYLWESRKRDSLGCCAGADWNAPRFCMVDVMKRYVLDSSLVTDIIAHASTYVRIFPVRGNYNPRDIYETELRKLFDYRTSNLASRLKKAVGKKCRVRYQTTTDGNLVEL